MGMWQLWKWLLDAVCFQLLPFLLFFIFQNSEKLFVISICPHAPCCLPPKLLLCHFWKLQNAPPRWSLKHGLLALPQCEQCALQYKWWVTHNHRKTCRFIIVFLWWVGPVRLSYILRIYYNTMRQRGCMYVPSCTALSSTRQLPAFEMLRKVYNTSVGLIMWSRFLTLFGLKVTN